MRTPEIKNVLRNAGLEVIFLLLVLHGFASGQTLIGLPDLLPTSPGRCATVPFDINNSIAGLTFVTHVPASALDPANPRLDNIAFSACGTGAWFGSSVVVGVGHLTSLPPFPFQFPIPGVTLGDFADFTVIYDASVSGPLSFTATSGAWSSLFPPSGAPSGPFVWNGVDDIGIYVSYASAVVGGWSGALHGGNASFPIAISSSGYRSPTGTLAPIIGPRVRLACSPPPPLFTTTVTPTAGGGALVSITGVPLGSTEGWMLISRDLTAVLGQGPVFGIRPDALTVAIVVGYPVPTTGNPLHWSWPTTNLFPAVPLTLPAGTATSFSGQTWDVVAVTQGLFGQIVGASSVARITW